MTTETNYIYKKGEGWVIGEPPTEGIKITWAMFCTRGTDSRWMYDHYRCVKCGLTVALHNAFEDDYTFMTCNNEEEGVFTL